MIPFASQRGGGQDLATHLQNEYDNDMVEVAHLRGAIAGDLHGAFKEWQVQAETLTKCEKYLYSLSINPDQRQGPLTREQYMDYIGRTETALGLGDQPRAVVFHIKHGREHCHVVWSRTDAENERAVHIAFDKEKLMAVTRGFARDHRLTLPSGYEKSRKVGQETLHERHQEQLTGLSADERMAQITEAWEQSDSAKSFVHALAEGGYLLAKGRRGYILVDLYGEINRLGRLTADKSLRKGVGGFLEKDFPLESLPSVEEARELVAEHRKLIEQSAKENNKSDRFAELKQAQGERRQSIERERETLKQKQYCLRLSQQAQHREQRAKLRANHLSTSKAVRQARYDSRPTGLAAFLGRVSGVSLLRQQLHRRQDAQRMQVYREQKDRLKVRQQLDQKTLDLRLRLQTREIERKVNDLEKIEKRELAGLSRDIKRDERIHMRGPDGLMPSLVRLAGFDEKEMDHAEPDLLAAFDQAKQARRDQAPDLTAAFERAAKLREEGEKDGGTGSGLENARPPEFGERTRGRKERDPERGR